jgi:hypothetical protein
MTALFISVIIILGWIVYEQRSAKKNQDEKDEKFKNYDLKRKDNFKVNPEFLDNYSKIKSLFRKIVDSEIDGLEVIRTFEPDDQTTQITRNISLKYNHAEFYISLFGTLFDCRCHFLSKSYDKLDFDIKFPSSEDDNKTLDRIIAELKRITKSQTETD